MAAADDGRPDRTDPGAARSPGGAERALDARAGEGVAALKQNIDRVADKVKGLLRSEH